MATIDVNTDGDLLIVTVTGSLTAAEAIAVVNEHYPTITVSNVLWDFTHGSVLSITRDEFVTIAKAVKQVLADGARPGGKTAFVAQPDVEYGLLRMHAVILEMEKVTIPYHVFKCIDEAKYWIKYSL